MIKFAGVSVETVQVQSEVRVARTFSRAEIMVASKPRVVVLTISVDPQEGIVPLAVFHGEAKRLEGSFELPVKVSWNGYVPFTRRRGEDNVDVILLEKSGHFTDISVGLATRGGKFFVSAQQTFKGYVARTKGAKVGEVEYEYWPTDDAHAYPGFNYSSVWGQMAEALVSVAQEGQASSQLSRVRKELADDREWWRKPMLPHRPGFRQGRVLFFHLITQTGKIRDKEGDWFVHFSDVNTPEKVLEPMAPVYFRLKSVPGEHKAVDVTPAA